MLFVTFMTVVTGIMAQDGPIRLHPENPRYFLFQGEPTLLVGSGEHYGAVLNLDFDHAPYLDELQRCELNLTRTFAGTYREVESSFKIRDNTLAPKAGRYQAPWAMEGDRYDLNRFDPAYFDRLRSFVAEAGKRGVVVEFVLFCPFYEEVLWEVNPLNARNNVNGVGDCPSDEVLTLDHPELLHYQLAFVDRVVRELNEFDNLYFEACNEPYTRGVPGDWEDRIIEAIVEAEADLPKRHLIARNIANETAKIVDPNPSVSIFNFHYATPPTVVQENAGIGLPIADDETGFDGHDDRTYRTEAWEFLLAGGSAFSNLDYSFTADHEDGTAPVAEPTPGGGGPALRMQLGVLRRFLGSFDLPRLAPSDAIAVEGGDDQPRAWTLAEAGRQYASYVRGGSPLTLNIDLPIGSYRAEWIDPRDGRVLGSEPIEGASDPSTLQSPRFEEDVALRILVEAQRD